MKIFWLAIVFLFSCTNTKEYLKTDEHQDEMAVLFVASPSSQWTGRGFRDIRYYACNTVFVARHLAVTSSACFSAKKGDVRGFDLNTIILENKHYRFTIENVFFVEEAFLVFLYTKEEGKPVYFSHQEVLYDEQLKLFGFSIDGFRLFSQMESGAIVRVTKFGNEQDGEFFIVGTEAAGRVHGNALFRQNGEFVGMITHSEKGRALAVLADVICRKIQEIGP